MNEYHAVTLEDSISPEGVRLTTFQITFPRFILAELNTHRMLSRNSASSRAIPTEKQIERVREHPFVPASFHKRVKGMGYGDELDDADADEARFVWLKARDSACYAAEQLTHTDKSRVNRLLEPYMWHTAIVTATEWDNFFALRCHPDAQPEFRKIATMMHDLMDDLHPRQLDYGEWHLPLVTEDVEGADDPHYWQMVSAGRCARVSYDTQDNYETPDASYERAIRLKQSGHMSPFEHVARPLEPDNDYRSWYPGQSYMAEHHPGEDFFVGNFRNWVQFRKEIPNEHNFQLTAGAVGK